MNFKLITYLSLSCVPFTLMADQSYYCPQKHGYINVGMTMDQVLSACGEPLSQQDSKQPLVQKIPVQQIIYNNQGVSNAFYGVWNIPTGSGGTSLQVNIIANRVKSVQVNGADSNAFSVCGGASIQIGDPVGKVMGACGNPAVINNTYTNQMVPTATKPQVWIYQPGEYQSTVSLTFIDGKLQSINN